MQSSKPLKFGVDSSPGAEQAAQALLNMRCAVDRCHDAVFITDLAGRIEFVNPAFEALTGYSVSKAVGRDLDLIATEDSDSDAYQAIQDEVASQGIYRGTQQLRRKDGSRFELDLAITAVHDGATRTTNLVYAGRDITEQRILQVELRRIRRMDAIAALAGGVAHDFNNLLMVISAYAELALNALYSEHPLRRNLKEVLGASRRASDLTRQLLVFGRGWVPGLQVISLNSEVEDACRVLPAVIGEDIELQLALGKDLAQVRADPGQIEQALLNLAINARDAMPNGGRLLIETQVVVLDDGFTLNAPGASPGKHVLLAITDSGQGIQAEELGRIFEPFYTTKPEGKGTGLGLAMVECVVKQNGGFISVDSVPGLGSTFNIYLPVAVAASSSKETSEFSTVAVCFPHGCEVLLVVKDEDALRECMVEFLSSIGYQAHAAANRQAAIGISAGADRIDLVISDVVLPDMGGPRLAERLAALRPEMKVCFMSGHAESVALRKGVSDLTRHFLQKPFSLQVLALKILEVLEEQAAAGVAAGGG
jgi:two-component system cell cycle sensor histidine kinase/response regulator CckA